MEIFAYIMFLECECNITGSMPTICDSKGNCICKPHVVTSKCTECEYGYYEFPNCKGKIGWVSCELLSIYNAWSYKNKHAFISPIFSELSNWF